MGNAPTQLLWEFPIPGLLDPYSNPKTVALQKK